MRIGVPAEAQAGEARVAMMLESAKMLEDMVKAIE
jgi:alanine dehydrogenase